MASTEVTQREGAQVPALAQTPATEITADDVALPKLKIGQFMSNAVQENLVPAGSLFTSLDQDDPDPQVLWEPGNDDGVTFYVLSLRKGKSVSEGGELVTFDFNDPDAPPDAWVTYTYAIAIPEVDEDLPFKFLLTRTGKPAAQQINLILKKNAAAGPSYGIAFEVRTAERSNDKGKFFVPRVRQVEADAKQVEVAERLALMIAGEPAAAQATGDEPSI